MLAVFVRERLQRLLVVVPTQPLRDQIVRKFESLGLLKKLGLVTDAAGYPVVGTLMHKPRTPDEVDDVFARCNVVVTTANIVGQCQPAVQARMAEQCSHLFIDEAHHISAPTWDSFRRAFLIRPVLQFTATPFRTDGKHVDGKVIFNYPLRKAQEEGYFKKVTFRPVYEFDRRLADSETARIAVEQLEADLAAGFDHIVMARAADIVRAEKVFEIYADVAAAHLPIILHSKLSDEDRREALQKLLSGETRIVVCVDMLGEGFDLPQLKIAALHDMHMSLAITLQFTGRFTRSHPGIGEATMVANIADELVEESLRALYAENADWNVLLRQLSEGATGRHVKRTDFLTRFTEVPAEVALQNVEPKMSAVFFRTRCVNWRPDRAKAALGEDRIYAGPALNPTDHTVLFITRDNEQVPWGNIRELSNTVWHLYLLHWNPEQQLLAINSSDHGSLHEGLAKAVCGEDLQLIRGENVFRGLHGINRLVLMNLGLNHTISRDIRFSMHVGSDI
jgi:superfamily II DNA or RNA helicase